MILFCTAFCTSCKFGIDWLAPDLVTVIEEAVVAKSIHSFIDLPIAIWETKEPKKVSPAAVVSMTFTL